MPLCQYCREDKNLVKAHVIPEAFFRTLCSQGETPSLLSATGYPKRRPMGEYDKEILCEDCEKLFSDVDTYGARVLLGEFKEKFTALSSAGETVAFEAEGIDQSLLLRFLVSVLWRASVSKQGFYGKVELGPHLSSAKASITCSSSEHLRNSSAVLSRWKAPAEKAISTFGFLAPFREKWDDVNAYRVYLGPFVAYIRVDRRPLPRHLEAIAIGQSRNLTVLAREFKGSNDFKAFVHLANSAGRKT